MLQLISYHLCPYAQRASIVLLEKRIDFERINIDLGDKPSWFTCISPLGKVPLLRVGEDVIFESAVICEYLEETQPGPLLHPTDPMQRAKHRAWTEFASASLSDIAGLYSAPDATAFNAKRASLFSKFSKLEAALGSGPFFAGERFSLVDAAFAPVFRYFDVLDSAGSFGLIPDGLRLGEWRLNLAHRPSVRAAVDEDYPSRLLQFLAARRSYLATLITRA